MSTAYKTEDHVRSWLADPSQKNRDRVVSSMEPVVRHIISGLRAPATDIVTYDDLFQAGIVGLLQALDQYSAEMNVRFVTFSYVRVRGEIIDLLRRMDPLPRRRRARVAAMHRIENELAQQHGEWPCAEAVAQILGLGPVCVETTRLDARRRERLSIHAPAGDSGDGEMLELLENPSAAARFEEAEWADVRHHLALAGSRLSIREQEILDLFFNEGLTQAEIGAFYGISEARVSQIRRRALERMRPRVEEALRQAA